MSDLAAIITASVGAVGAAGTGIAWLWARVEKRFAEVERKLEACEEREGRHTSVIGKHLIVIELLWQVASKNKTAAPVLARCKEHLDELKSTAKKDVAND